MKKFSMLFLAAAVALVGAIVAPTKAEAIPAFARQVGVPCYSCHFQHIPKLNSFGREFKLGGFTQSAQDLIQDEGLSLPPAFGAAVVSKFRFIQGSPDAAVAKYGVWNLPDEAGILAGGRVAENMGALFEFNATTGGAGNGNVANNKFVYSKDFGGIRGGVVAYASADQGPGYSMELFNTGAQRGQFGIENAAATVRGAVNGPWNMGAQGLGFFAGNDLFFANVGLYGPAGSSYAGGMNPDAGFNLSQYIRVAVTPKVGDGMDLMVGLQLTSGETKVNNAGVDTKYKTDAMKIDAQVQTTVSGMSLEVIANYATVKANSVYAGGTANDLKGMDLAAMLGVTKHAGLKAGFGSMDNGAAAKSTYTAFMVGGWIAPAQNVDLSLEYVSATGDAKPFDSKMVLMLEFAF